MALARAFARYLAPMHRYAAADNRRTRHLILPGGVQTTWVQLICELQRD